MGPKRYLETWRRRTSRHWEGKVKELTRPALSLLFLATTCLCWRPPVISPQTSPVEGLFQALQNSDQQNSVLQNAQPRRRVPLGFLVFRRQKDTWIWTRCSTSSPKTLVWMWKMWTIQKCLPNRFQNSARRRCKWLAWPARDLCTRNRRFQAYRRGPLHQIYRAGLLHQTYKAGLLHQIYKAGLLRRAFTKNRRLRISNSLQLHWHFTKNPRFHGSRANRWFPTSDNLTPWYHPCFSTNRRILRFRNLWLHLRNRQLRTLCTLRNLKVEISPFHSLFPCTIAPQFCRRKRASPAPRAGPRSTAWARMWASGLSASSRDSRAGFLERFWDYWRLMSFFLLAGQFRNGGDDKERYRFRIHWLMQTLFLLNGSWRCLFSFPLLFTWVFRSHHIINW